MATDERDADRHARIGRLRAQASAAVDGHMIVHESDALAPDAREQFWRNVVAYETAEMTTLTKELTTIGVALPEPDGLDDKAVHEALWNVINGLARLGVFLDQTDRLSDRELYTHVLREQLPQEMPALELDEHSAWHIDILGRGSPEDVKLYLTYYADDGTRESLRTNLPEGLPPHVDPPYDRDRELPQPWWS